MVSLFTDMASEMLYPVMPLYLEYIGFSALGIGILEGVAQATAGLSKGYFGKWSDQAMRRVPFVQLGYLLSAVSKPLMAVWTAPLWVLFARTVDRLGKGIRTGARDAMLAATATADTRARVFGFHRGMDTLGAAIGPALALLFLWKYPSSYRTLFYLAFLPGLLAVLTTLWLGEPTTETEKRTRPGWTAFISYVPQSSPAYRRLLWGLLAFALLNSSDLFLLLLIKQRGWSDTAMIGLYIFYNLIYALAAYPAGSLADRWGVKRVFMLGLLLFSLVYGGMAVAGTIWHFGVLLLFYGFYAAATEGVAKAWISQIVPKKDTATAIGTYEGLRSVATLLASSLAGLVWVSLGPDLLFIAAAALTVLIIFYFHFGIKA